MEAIPEGGGMNDVRCVSFRIYDIGAAGGWKAELEFVGEPAPREDMVPALRRALNEYLAAADTDGISTRLAETWKPGVPFEDGAIVRMADGQLYRLGPDHVKPRKAHRIWPWERIR
jgi:hypothetical protein